MSKPCTYCQDTTHTQFLCPIKPRKGLSARKPFNQIGKQGKKTAAAVAKWKRTQKSNHEGYFICYICSKWIEYLEAEHVKSKARNPALRTDPNNLKPVCDPCNKKKGSKDNE